MLSVAVLLAGGAALAQADLIVDPWKRVFSGKAPAPAVAVVVHAPKASPSTDSGWLDDTAKNTAAPAPILAPWPVGESISDPWVRRAPDAAPATPPAPARAGAPRGLHASNWARVLPEIIDPWGPRRLAAYQDPLIVDPWPN